MPSWHCSQEKPQSRNASADKTSSLHATDARGKVMTADGISVDETELAAQLRTCGLVRTVADRGYRRLDDGHSALLETLAKILNATDAPPIDLNIEEALAELKGPRFFFVQHILCDLIPLLNVVQGGLLVFLTRLLAADGIALAARAPCTAVGQWPKTIRVSRLKVYDASRPGANPALRPPFTVLVMNGDIDAGLIFAQAHEREAELAALSALG